MRIAISTDGSSVSAHFGRCPSFTIVDIEDGKVAGKEVVDNPGHQPGFIPQFLHEKGVNCIIAGGMGMRATGFFSELGIQSILGISGQIDEVIEKLDLPIAKYGREGAKSRRGGKNTQQRKGYYRE